MSLQPAKRPSVRQTAKVQLSASGLERGASGIGRVARLMARVLSEEAAAGKLDVTALSLAKGPEHAFGVRVQQAHNSQLGFLVRNGVAALRAGCFVYDFAGVARAHPSRRLARPYLTWMHGIEVWENARPDHLDRLRAANVLLVNSAYTRERACGLHSGLKKAHVCWLATEEDEPAEPLLEDHPPTVLIVSRIDASEGYKGHRELIEAWPSVRKQVPDAQLQIAGDGSGRAGLEELARRIAPDSDIQFLGFAADEDLPLLMRRANVFAMPSRGEGFGLAYIEAMRCGLPVVASIHDAAQEINLHEVTGLNVDLDRAASLPGALVQLLAEPSYARSLGDAGKRRWAEHFRYSHFRQRFGTYLETLLHKI